MERNTRQRDAIRAVLEESGRPMSPKEIHDAAKEEVSGLGLATVYRTINSLLDSNWIVSVELPGEPPRYELAGKGHHHHFRCNDCGSVYEVLGCPGNLDELLPKGFRLQGHELILFGKCKECTQTPSAASVHPQEPGT